MPSWVPIYPRSVLASDVTITRTPQKLYFGADYSTKDLCNVAISWYKDKLRETGFIYGGRDVHMPAPVCQYADDSPDAANGNSGSIAGDSADHTHTLTVSWYRRNFPKGDSEQVMYLIHLVAVERNHGAPPETLAGRAQPQIPDWAPIYPGTTPSQMGVAQTSGGTDIRFELSTNDDCGTVIDWYRQRLQSSGFRTFDRSDNRSRKSGCDSRISAEAPQGRSMKIRAVTYTFSVNIDVETLQK